MIPSSTASSSPSGDESDDPGNGAPRRAPLNEDAETRRRQQPPLPPPHQNNNQPPRRRHRHTFAGGNRGALSFSFTKTNTDASGGTVGDVETGGGHGTPLASSGGSASSGTQQALRSIFRGGLGSSLRRHSGEASAMGIGGGGGTNNNTLKYSRRGSNESNPASEMSSSSRDSGGRGGGHNNNAEVQVRGAHHSPARGTRKSRFTLPLGWAPGVIGGTPHNNDNVGSEEYYNDDSRNGQQRDSVRSRMTAFRRFAVGDYVLISNHNKYPEGHEDGGGAGLEGTEKHNSNIIQRENLVNRYGFPEWGGGATTSEERRGPYLYLLSQVRSVHFGEYAQYYTVRREDNMEDQRADAQYMEPITNASGIEAAKLAAHKGNESGNGNGRDMGRSGKGVRGSRAYKSSTDALKKCTSRIRDGTKKFIRRMKARSNACLNGNRPYGINFRFTGVNMLVLCSIWYLYIDQLRLAFMPHSADFGCAVVSCIVWIVLFLELVMEVFIRPTGYRALIKSERAYLPSTVRYLNSFHLISEMISLAFFVPEFICLFDPNKSCGDRYSFSLANSCLMSIYGPDRLHAFYGTAFICMLRLRIFGLVRHWTKMWINNTFVRVMGKNGEWRVQRGKGYFVPQGHQGGRGQNENVIAIAIEESMMLMTGSNKHRVDMGSSATEEKKNDYSDDYHLTNASKIGTALFTTNAQRGLLFIFVIGLFPLIPVAFQAYGGTNQQPWNSVDLLQSNNLALNSTDNATCGFFQNTILLWSRTNVFEADVDGSKTLHILSLSVEPVRCPFQIVDGAEDAATLAAVLCREKETNEKCAELIPIQSCEQLCLGWAQASEEDRLGFAETYLGVRPEVTISIAESYPWTYSEPDGKIVAAIFSTRVLYNEELSVKRTIITLFILQLSMTLFVLLGLSVLRNDAGRLVLGPLRRMLKIVAFYAKNPLSPPPQREGGGLSLASSFQRQNEAYFYDSDDEATDMQLGTFETGQLINAVTKITELLRKCWGVAGAGIISSNLARQEMGLSTYFNPTVKGKAVYALFAFAAIDKFQSHLHALKGDIMILINDIAAVLHEEVYRWGYEESGQCNKNLGNAFLMVYRIGAVSEVLEKREKAEAVIFSGKNATKLRRRTSVRRVTDQHRRLSSLGGSERGFDADKFSRSRVDKVDLSSLPGMRTFTDRALLGLLKTFAGIHRDKTILNWNNDFRLGAGVGAVSVNLNFGMDAGWAVEGAVGSSYKIDATYLSPHVNMASRMMSATKQYGVYFLLSEAVQKLLTGNAQDKLRHIDTVTVKGSSVQQKIFTYDAKVRSDFFLYSRSDVQADSDSERYSPQIWNVDQDLVAMRSHISDEFMEVFNKGRDEYLAGNWPAAIRLLKAADKIMFEREVEEGYSNKAGGSSLMDLSLNNIMDEDVEGAEERLSMGDGPCQRLIVYMKEMGGEAPPNWKGYRPLTSK